VVMLDNLQSADSPSVRLILSALAAHAQRPFFVLCLGRPELRVAHPDLLTRRGGTPVKTDSAVALIRLLNADTITQDLNGAAAYLKSLKAVRGDRIGVIGFCWGGSQSFRYATNNPALRAFVVCYGAAPDTAAMRRIQAPGLGVYAENDARITANVPDAATALKAAGRDYRYAVYAGVGHGFLRQTDKPAVADTAWAAVMRFFRDNLETK